jgi:diketogulonate reductase-like aldo/keto reductase
MEIPPVGLGTWQLTDAEKLEAAVLSAVEECGCHSIGTVQAYVNKQVIDAAEDLCKRSDQALWITTKLWVTSRRPDSSSRRSGSPWRSSRRLCRPLLDSQAAAIPRTGIYSRTTPIGLLTAHIDILDTWTAMEPLAEKGLTRHIGVSNFSTEMPERTELSLRVKIRRFANQVEQPFYCQQWVMTQYLGPRWTKFTALSQFCCAKAGLTSIRLQQDSVLPEVVKPSCTEVPASVVADR